MPLFALIRPLLDQSVAAYSERLAREARVLRDVAYLKSFDDRLLLDIGLKRSEIEAYVRRRLASGPLVDDCTEERVMRIAGLFTEHPASAGETYGEHMRVALSFARPLAKATGAALVHAFFPFLFTRTASATITTLHERMARRCAACGNQTCQKSRLHLLARRD